MLVSFVLRRVFLCFPLQPTFPVGPTIGTNAAISFAPYLAPVTPGVGLVPTEVLPTTPVIVPGSPPVTVPGSTATQKLLRTDKLEVLQLRVCGGALMAAGYVCESGWICAENPCTRLCTSCCSPVCSQFCAVKLKPSVKEISPKTRNNLGMIKSQLRGSVHKEEIVS